MGRSRDGDRVTTLRLVEKLPRATLRECSWPRPGRPEHLCLVGLCDKCQYATALRLVSPVPHCPQCGRGLYRVMVVVERLEGAKPCLPADFLYPFRPVLKASHNPYARPLA